MIEFMFANTVKQLKVSISIAEYEFATLTWPIVKQYIEHEG